MQTTNITKGSQAHLERIKERFDGFMKSGANPAFREINELASGLIKTAGYPHRTHEMFTFVNTADPSLTFFDIAEQPISLDDDTARSLVYRGCENSVLFFINGSLDRRLSSFYSKDGKISISPVEQNQAAKREILERTKSEKDIFALLNAAFMKEAFLLDVNDGVSTEGFIQLIFAASGSGESPALSTPHILIRIGEGADIGIIVRFISLDERAFSIPALSISAGEGSKIKYICVHEGCEDSRHLIKTFVSLSKDAHFTCITASNGSALVRHNYEIHLHGEGAETDFNAVSILKEKEQAHNYVRLHHEAMGCISRLRFRNILKDKARASVDSTVVVHPGAKLSDSNQIMKSLMLSPDAKADSKPNLMIYADDVKCTHGSAVGQIDPEQLFYLKTRCFSQDMAQRILTTSFADEIIGKIPFAPARDGVRKMLLGKLER
ncbi:MAG: Fe-S cluster assembly protein SufD [Nitrospinae bacterium]|nr:Fe-S cluster assembly protein SufD [Nitrospinota bacterium]